MRKVIALELAYRLRSGKYKQGHRRLKVMLPDGTFEYCCLGVLCEMAVEADVIEPSFADEHWDMTDEEFAELHTFEGHTGILPLEVMRWAGMSYQNGSFLGGDDSLSWMNDRGHTFVEIADTLETEFDNL